MISNALLISENLRGEGGWRVFAKGMGFEKRRKEKRERKCRERGESRVPRVMNHAFSSPRNEVERCAVARPVRQINNVICSPGSRPIRSGPKDFVRMVYVWKDECRSSALSERGGGGGSLFLPSLPPSLFSSQPSSSFHSLPLFSDNRTCQRQRWCLNKGAK